MLSTRQLMRLLRPSNNFAIITTNSLVILIIGVDRVFGSGLIGGAMLAAFFLLSLASQELDADFPARSSLQRLRNFIDRFTRNQRHIYQKHLIYRYQQFDVRGISESHRQELGIADVYVQLRVVSRDLNNDQTGHFLDENNFLDGDYSIWEILANDHLNHVVIVGPPGSGKTTLLQHIVLTLCDSSTPSPVNKYPIPIFLFLGSHVNTIKSNPKINLLEIIQESLRRQVYAGRVEWLITQLRKGNCLVLLDGLDEVADTQLRHAVVTWIYAQMTDKAYRNNRFIITSRSHGYQGNLLPPELVTVFEVLPFNDDQIRNYIHNWYVEDERSRDVTNSSVEAIQKVVAKEVNDCIVKIFRTPALHELATNPLLLMMMATVHRYSSTLPKRRADLYDKICEVFLGKLDRLKQHHHPLRATTYDIDQINASLDLNEKRSILQLLAFRMMLLEVNTLHIDDILEIIGFQLSQYDSAIDSRQFLAVIEERGGILLQVDTDTYGFVHLTFQEYLASLHIAAEGLDGKFPSWVDSAWWHETLRLYSAHTDIRAVLKACFAGKPPSTLALTLALECAEEATDPVVMQKVADILAKWANDIDPRLRHVVAEVKLTFRLNRLNRLDSTYDPYQEMVIDQSLITHVEYQLFLDEQRRQQNHFHPDHWTSFDFRTGQGDTNVVGVRPSDAKTFCQWLTRWSKSTDSLYRLPKHGEFRNLPIKGGYWVEGSGEFLVAGIPSNIQQLSPQQLAHQISVDIAPLIALEADYAYKLIAELDNQLDRSLNEGLDHRSLAIARALNVALMQFRARVQLAPHLNRYLLSTSKQNIGDLLQETRRHFDTATISREQRQQALHRARRLAPEVAVELKTLREVSLKHAQTALPNTSIGEMFVLAASDAEQYIHLRSKTYPTSRDIAEPFALSLVDDFVGIFDLGTDSLRDLDKLMTTVFDTYMRHQVLKHLSQIVKANSFNINPYIDLDRVYQLHDDLQIAYWKVKDLNLRSQQDKNLARELAERLNLSRTLADYIFMGLDLARRTDDMTYYDFGRWTSRVLTLIIIGLLEIEAYQHLYESTSGRRTSNLTLLLLLKGFMQLYADLANLEYRTQSELPAIEGILIVKDKSLRA